MRRLLLLVGVCACEFEHGALTPGDRDGGSDADAPPTSAAVRFVSVTSSEPTLRPGLYGITVTAVLRNELAVEITAVAPTLAFADSAGDRAKSFRWREADLREGAGALPPATIAAGAEATYVFVVDALPWAVPPGPILVDGRATFSAGGTRLSATPLDPPRALDFAPLAAPIVVDTAVDEVDQDATTSFREALSAARAAPGLDRIVFASTAFPAGTVTMLDEALGELPGLDGTGGALVIDGSGAHVTLAVGAEWEQPEGRWGLRVTGGSVVISGISFRDFGFNYRDETPLSNNCGASGMQLDGGAIRVDGGTVVLDGNTFADPNVGERNCYASLVRFEGGTGHRIVKNRWTQPSQDAISLRNARVREISDNVMDAIGGAAKADECIYIFNQGGGDLWVTGNLCIDQEYSAMIANGSDAGTLYVINNTFVREAYWAVRRSGGARNIVARNNVYIRNNPAALGTDADGAGFDLAYEATIGNSLCTPGCASAAIDAASMIAPADAMVENVGGSSRADFAPIAGSPLLSSGAPLLDRNGGEPGRFAGAGSDRGAVEVP